MQKNNSEQNNSHEAINGVKLLHYFNIETRSNLERKKILSAACHQVVG